MTRAEIRAQAAKAHGRARAEMEPIERILCANCDNWAMQVDLETHMCRLTTDRALDDRTKDIIRRNFGAQLGCWYGLAFAVDSGLALGPGLPEGGDEFEALPAPLISAAKVWLHEATYAEARPDDPEAKRKNKEAREAFARILFPYIAPTLAGPETFKGVF